MCVLRNAAFRLEGKVCLSCKFFVSCLIENPDLEIAGVQVVGMQLCVYWDFELGLAYS
jgi:hypothetical protein